MNDNLALDRAIDAEIDDYIAGRNTYHMFAGFGIRCGYQAKPKETVRISLSWDSVTCPDCLAKKQDYEPWKADIDTRGD